MECISITLGEKAEKASYKSGKYCEKREFKKCPLPVRPSFRTRLRERQVGTRPTRPQLTLPTPQPHSPDAPSGSKPRTFPVPCGRDDKMIRCTEAEEIMQVFCVLSGLISQEQEIHLSSNLRVEGLRVSKSISISSGFVSRKEDSRVWMM